MSRAPCSPALPTRTESIAGTAGSEARFFVNCVLAFLVCAGVASPLLSPHGRVEGLVPLRGFLFAPRAGSGRGADSPPPTHARRGCSHRLALPVRRTLRSTAARIGRGAFNPPVPRVANHSGARGYRTRETRWGDGGHAGVKRRRGTPRDPGADRAVRSRAEELAAAAAGETQGRTQPPAGPATQSHAVIKKVPAAQPRGRKRLRSHRANKHASRSGLRRAALELRLELPATGRPTARPRRSASRWAGSRPPRLARRTPGLLG